MTFAKILCPTDFSAGSQQALRVAVRIVKETNAELVIAHAWYIPAAAFAGESTFAPYMIQGMVDDAQRALDEAVREASAAGAKNVIGKLLSGVPWAEIVTLLENQAFDLCVIGTHGRTGVSRVLLGSVAEKVVRHAPCSVLAVHADGEPRPFRHVLVPTDFSASADHALELATKLVHPEGTLRLLHAVELPVRYSAEFPVQEGFGVDLDHRATAALEKAATKLKSETSAHVVTYCAIGYPGGETLALLDREPTIDLVVLGSHGRTGIKRALLGSVAEKVVRHAKCPVLVARKRV